MISAFQPSAFQNDAFQIDGSGVVVAPVQRFVGAGVDVPTWEQAVQKRFDDLSATLKAEVKEQKQVVRKIAQAKKKLVTAKNPDGILANLHLLEERQQVLTRQIKDLRLQVQWAKLEFEKLEDEEEEELLLLH